MTPARVGPRRLIPTPAGSWETHAGARRALFYSYCTLRESFFSAETHPAGPDEWRPLLSALVHHFAAFFFPLSFPSQFGA